MFSEMIRLFQERSDFFLQLTLEHIAISLVAIVLAIVIGGAMGILIAEVDRMAQPTLLVVNFLYTIPSIAMFGFLLPFSGIGNTTAIIALTLYALLPMVKNTHTGLKNVDPLLIEAAVGMGSTRFQVLRRIALPLAMPVILAGIRNMTTMTIALAGIASFIGAGGLGIATPEPLHAEGNDDDHDQHPHAVSRGHVIGPGTGALRHVDDFAGRAHSRGKPGGTAVNPAVTAIYPPAGDSQNLGIEHAKQNERPVPRQIVDHFRREVGPQRQANDPAAELVERRRAAGIDAHHTGDGRGKERPHQPGQWRVQQVGNDCAGEGDEETPEDGGI